MPALRAPGALLLCLGARRRRAAGRKRARHALASRTASPLGDTSLASASMVEPGGRGGRGGRGGKGSTGKGRGRFGRGGEGSSNKVVTIFKPEQGTKSGIRLQGSDGPPTIVSLNPEGVAADVLAAGERLLAVNGEIVTGHEAGTQMLKSAVGSRSKVLAQVAIPALS